MQVQVVTHAQALSGLEQCEWWTAGDLGGVTIMISHGTKQLGQVIVNLNAQNN